MKNKEAIEILKTESCADCSCHPESPTSCINTKCPLAEATLLAIKALEAQRWIPLTKDTIDRLKDHHWYLITHKDYETPIKAKFHLGGLQHFTWYNGGGIWCCSYYIEGYDNEVLAWMPLPEPYKEEDDT